MEDRLLLGQVMSKQNFAVSIFGRQSLTGTAYVRAEFCCISLWRAECYFDGLCQSRVLLYQFVEGRVLLGRVMSEQSFAVSICVGQSVTGTGYVRSAFCSMNLRSINSICSFICHLANGQLTYQNRS